MANYNYKRGYTVAELEALLVQVKAEWEKYRQSESDSGSLFFLREGCVCGDWEEVQRHNGRFGIPCIRKPCFPSGECFAVEGMVERRDCNSSKEIRERLGWRFSGRLIAKVFLLLVLMDINSTGRIILESSLCKLSQSLKQVMAVLFINSAPIRFYFSRVGRRDVKSACFTLKFPPNGVLRKTKPLF